MYFYTLSLFSPLLLSEIYKYIKYTLFLQMWCLNIQNGDWSNPLLTPAILPHLTFSFFFFPKLVLIQLIFQKHVPSHTNTCLEERISSRGLIQAVKAEKKSRLQLWEGNRLTKLMKYENAPMHHFSLSVATSMVSTTVPPFVLT